jgi:peptidoglycan hydrolase-like protein with peptidoglycan-binding domain
LLSPSQKPWPVPASLLASIKGNEMSTNVNPNSRTSVLGNLIGSGEGGYYSFNRGIAGDSVGQSLDANITVGEIMRLQALSYQGPDQLFAVGKYQMIGPYNNGPNDRDPIGTFKRAVDAVGVGPNERFTPELQEQMFHAYLIKGKRPEIYDYISGKTSGASGLYEAQLGLALEFASVGSPRKNGVSEHAGSAGNAASITVQESADALNQMREKFLAGKRNGLSDEAAYQALQDQPIDFSREPGQRNYLQRGDQGERVRELQEKLTSAGFSTKGVDGIYGRDTELAVRGYQQANGLPVDGVAGEQTLLKLGIAVQQTTPATPAPAPSEIPSQNPQPTPTPAPTTQPSTDQPANPGTSLRSGDLNNPLVLVPGNELINYHFQRMLEKEGPDIAARAMEAIYTVKGYKPDEPIAVIDGHHGKLVTQGEGATGLNVPIGKVAPGDYHLVAVRMTESLQSTQVAPAPSLANPTQDTPNTEVKRGPVLST